MSSRRELTREMAGRYRHSDKNGKGRILDEFCRLTKHNRSYAGLLLRSYRRRGRVVAGGQKTVKLMATPPGGRSKGRPRVYDEEVARVIKGLWASFGFLCGRRLAVFLSQALPLMKQQRELDLRKSVYEKLLHVSGSTLDRLLRPERQRMQLRGHSYSGAAKGLMLEVPIRTWSDWDRSGGPGEAQVDLVGHDGGSSSGEFAFTLTVTDYACQWTERRAVANRAEKWVRAALEEIRWALPFPLRAINTDSGSEFINRNLLRYCRAEAIAFTRSRPQHKNDNCLVEQKNYDAVRKIVGYLRYDSEDQLALLNEIYQLHSLLQNYLYPSQRLLEKVRVGSRVRKRHDKACSPCQRLLQDSRVADDIKERLRKQLVQLKPLSVSRQISRLQDQLQALAKHKAAPALLPTGAAL